MRFSSVAKRVRAVVLMLAPWGAGLVYGAAAPPVPQPPAHLSEVARPLNYDLQIVAVPIADRFSGRVAIELNVANPTAVLWLNAVHLDVHRASVTAAGKTQVARAFFSHDVLGLRFAQPLPAGHATLLIEYDGNYEHQGQLGLVKVREGDDWYIATNLEPDYARRVVPCFDDLDSKATWKITLDVPNTEGAYANAAETGHEPLSATMKRVHFAQTLPIPTYAMAFAIGPFDVVDGGHAGRRNTPIRILVPKGAAAMARFAADSTGRLLNLTEDYVGEAYPFDKLDVVALPNLDRFGAMENVGLITADAAIVLAPPGRIGPAFEEAYVITAAHEIAHMWFGNWLTPSSWRDLWLNEAMAEFLERKTANRFNPEWQENLQVDDERAQALMADRLLTAHPLRTTSDSGEVAEDAFDTITYAKGASVLRMMEAWMGEERFRDGVRRYVAGHQGAMVNADHLIAALAAAAEPAEAGDVQPVLQGFLEQAGAPALDVGLQCSEGSKPSVRLDLNQGRFAPRAHIAPALPAASLPAAQHWTFPVCFQYGEGGDFGESCTMVRDTHTTFNLPAGERCPNWVIANTDGRSYVLPLLRDPLTAHLTDAPLLPDEAVPVMNDASVSFASDAIGADSALGLAKRFANHRQPMVALAAVKLIKNAPQGLIDADDQHDAWTRFVRTNFGPRAELLGWTPKGSEREVDDMLRVELVPMAADIGADPVLRSEADRLARDNLAGHAELGEMFWPIFRTAANNGNEELFNAIVAAAAHAASPMRGYYFAALGAFRDPKLIALALDLALSDRTDVTDGRYIVDAAAENHPAGPAVEAYVRAHFDAIERRYGVAGLLAGASHDLCDRTQRQDLEAFVNDHAARAAALKEAMAPVFENAQICEAGRDLQASRLKAALTP